MDYRFEWITHPNRGVRLQRGLNLIRNVISIVFPGRVVAGWSKPSAPYEGVMKGTRPKTIQINPSALLRARPGDDLKGVIAVLHAVPLHEAGHAAWTPGTWGRQMSKALAAHRASAGYSLPQQIVDAIVNYVEDVFVEGRVVRKFRFFADDFDQAYRYFYPDEICRQVVEGAYARWPTDERDLKEKRELVQALVNLLVVQINRRTGHEDWRAAVVACMNLLGVLFRRPGVVEDLCQPTFAPLIDAARDIRGAGKQRGVAARMKEAVRISDDVFRFLRPLIPEATEGAEGDTASLDAASQAIDAALEGERTCIMRDGGNPIGTESCEDARSAEYVAAFKSMEEQQIASRPARVIDSSPAVLPSYQESYSLVAAELLATYRHLAQSLKRRLSLHHGSIEVVEGGRRTGELDENALDRIVMGDADVYRQRYRVAAPRVDLTLLVDESGSMRTGDHWRLACAAMICVEYAVCDLEGVRLRALGFTSDCFERGETVLFRHYDSAIPRLRRRYALGWSYPKSYNADGIALAAVHRILRSDRPHNVIPYLLMISDGMPNAHGYEGEAAREHVRQEVQSLQRSGIRFAHLQIGPTSSQALTAMYGSRWSRVTQPAEIPERVIELVSRWLSPPEDSI